MAIYDREKTLAILTGLLCVLVFLAGTALGGYHAFLTIGVGAGILALASYGIADVVIAWASFIDYKESGGAMEWTAWAIKYPLSLYLLVSGGCIAYTMFYTAETANDRTAAVVRASDAQKRCLEAPGAQRGRQAACQKIYESTLASESKLLGDKKGSEASTEKAVQAFLRFPLFHYIPGILGVFGMIGLTLVAKLTADHSERLFSTGKAQMRFTSASAPLVNRKTASVTNGKGCFLSLKRNAIRFRMSGMNEKHVAYVSDAEMPVLESLDYAGLAAESLKRRRANVGNDDLCQKIQDSL